jgi:hypothetical protein
VKQVIAMRNPFSNELELILQMDKGIGISFHLYLGFGLQRHIYMQTPLR